MDRMPLPLDTTFLNGGSTRYTLYHPVQVAPSDRQERFKYMPLYNWTPTPIANTLQATYSVALANSDRSSCKPGDILVTHEANDTTLNHSRIGVVDIPAKGALVQSKFITQCWRGLLFAVGGVRNTDMIKAVSWHGKIHKQWLAVLAKKKQ